MSYVESTLRPNESLVVRGNLHWILLIPTMLWWLGSFAALWYGFQYTDTERLIFHGLAAFLALGGTLVGIAALLRLWTTEYAVTSARVVAKHGWIRRTTTSLPGARIESVHVDQTVLGRMFDFGTVTIRGTGDHSERLVLLRNPIAFRNAAMDIISPQSAA